MATMNSLNYNTYEEYLNSFINANDVRYMRNWTISRKFVQDACGLRGAGHLMSRNEFEDELRKRESDLKPAVFHESTLFSYAFKGSDPVLQQFALREYKLLSKQISASIEKMKNSLFIYFLFLCHTDNCLFANALRARTGDFRLR